MELQITHEEAELMKEILEERHRELLREISRAHRHEFKLVLRKNEELLRAVITKLSAMHSGIPAFHIA